MNRTAPHSCRVHLPQFIFSDVRGHHSHAPGAAVRVAQGVHHGAVVGAVAGGLHDDAAGKAQAPAQFPEFLFGRIAGRVLAVGSVGEQVAGAEYVAMSIDCARGHGERRFGRVWVECQPVFIHG